MPEIPEPPVPADSPAVSPRVRSFVADDADTVAGWLQHSALRQVAVRRWLPRLLRDARIEARIAERRGCAVGFVRLDLAPDRSAELTVVVDPAHRRCGVGAALLGAARELAAARGVTRLVAWIEPGNRAALRLFGAAGFEPTGGGPTGRYARFERLIHGADRQPPLEILP